MGVKGGLSNGFIKRSKIHSTGHLMLTDGFNGDACLHVGQ